MATHIDHLHTPAHQRAGRANALDPRATAQPKARLEADYASATAKVVPHAWNAIGAILTVALLAAFAAMFAGEWRLSVAHSLVGVLAFAAVVLQIRHLRRDRVLTQRRESTRAMTGVLDIMDGSRPAPRGHSRMTGD
ncbi:hypothetical protein JCM19000A_30210 [Silvimonas sp. JCM 19000]